MEAVLALAAALAVLVGLSLGLLGGGGAVLTTPLLAYVVGLAPKQAIASSLVVVGATSALGAALHARNVEWRVGAIFGAGGVLGAFLGGRAAVLFSGTALLVGFAVMMLAAGAAMLRPRRARAPRRLDVPRAFAAGAIAGAASGLVGAGGGFLVVPALVLWGGLPMLRAVGTSLFVIAIQSFAAFAGHVAHTAVHVAPVAIVTAGALAGAVLGAKLAGRVRADALRRGFGVFVLVTACVVLVKELAGGVS